MKPTVSVYREADDSVIPVVDKVAPWTCRVCGDLVLDHERHEHTAKEWREAK